MARAYVGVGALLGVLLMLAVFSGWTWGLFVLGLFMAWVWMPLVVVPAARPWRDVFAFFSVVFVGLVLFMLAVLHPPELPSCPPCCAGG